MFDHKHYIPVLRWKRAEWKALGDLASGDRDRVTPLLELTPLSFRAKKNKPAPDPKDVLAKNAADMLKYWHQAPFFLDLCHLGAVPDLGNGLHALQFLAERTRNAGLHLIPATGLGRAPAYQSAIASIIATDGFGICIRVHPAEIQRQDFSTRLSGTLANFGLEPEEVDLFVDYRLWDGGPPSFSMLCTHLPEISRWRTLTHSSGTFPRDLSGFTIGEHQLARSDWLAWRTQVSTGNLPRLPSFSDYTIQHADFAEPPEYANFSASIRYASGGYWVIMRGEGVFLDNGPGFHQWPANAQLLCGRAEFCGPTFSAGDKYIFDMGNQITNTGNAETWLRAGINHHVTFTVRQIANIS
jgi:Beta protein